MSTFLKPQFVSQYLAIVATIENQTGIRQGDIAKANARLASRGTILTRMTELTNAGVIERAYGFGPPSEVRYQVLNTAPLDALTGTKTAAQPVVETNNLTDAENEVLTVLKTRKSRDRRGWTYATMGSSLGDYSQARDGLDGLVAKGLVSKSGPQLGNARRFNLVEEKAPAAAPVKPAVEDDDGQMRRDILAMFADTRDQKWLTFDDINHVCGQGSLDQTENVLDDMVDAGVLARTENDSDSHISCYNWSYRLASDTRWPSRKKAAPAPAEAPQSVETPVEAPAVVEAPETAPTPSLTLRDIIEQAVQAAMAVAAQRDAVQIASLIAERDAAREQLAAVKKLLA